MSKSVVVTALLELVRQDEIEPEVDEKLEELDHKYCVAVGVLQQAPTGAVVSIVAVGDVTAPAVTDATRRVDAVVPDQIMFSARAQRDGVAEIAFGVVERVVGDNRIGQLAEIEGIVAIVPRRSVHRVAGHQEVRDIAAALDVNSLVVAAEGVAGNLTGIDATAVPDDDRLAAVAGVFGVVEDVVRDPKELDVLLNADEVVGRILNAVVRDVDHGPRTSIANPDAAQSTGVFAGVAANDEDALRWVPT